MHEQSFENIAVPAQMSPPHPTRFIEKSIGSLQQFAPLSHQPLPALTLDATPIGIHCVALGVLIDPVLPAPIRFADVAAQSQQLYIEHGLLAVVTLVGDQLLPRLHLVVSDRGYRFQLLDRFGQRRLYRGGVALIGFLQRNGHDRPGLQIHRMLGFVR